jgi:type II secretory pathway pseudopilin PulG
MNRDAFGSPTRAETQSPTRTQVLVILSAASAAKDLFRREEKRPFAALRVTAIAVSLFSVQYRLREKGAPPPRTRLRRAFTLVEAAISVVIVSGMMLASITTLGAVCRARRVQAERQEALALAHGLMAEVLQSYYVDPASTGSFGPPPGATRATFNGVDDYDAYRETPPSQKDGTVMTDFTGWSRSVHVNWAEVSDATTVSNSDTGLKRITVTVTSPSGKQTFLSGLRSKFDPYEQTPLQSANYLLWAGVDLQIGSNGRTIHAAAHPMNETVTQP